MSIIKSNGSDILSGRKEIILSIPKLNDIELQVNRDMLGRELKLYDWVLIVTSNYERLQKRIGTIVKFTDKKVTVLARDNWTGRDVEKTSVYSDKLLKIDESFFSHLLNLEQ